MAKAPTSDDKPAAPKRKPAAAKKESTLGAATKASKDALDSTVKAVKKNPGTTAGIAAGVVAAVAGAAFGASKLAESRKKKAAEDIDPNAVPDGISVQ